MKEINEGKVRKEEERGNIESLKAEGLRLQAEWQRPGWFWHSTISVSVILHLIVISFFLPFLYSPCSFLIPILLIPPFLHTYRLVRFCNASFVPPSLLGKDLYSVCMFLHFVPCQSLHSLCSSHHFSYCISFLFDFKFAFFSFSLILCFSLPVAPASDCGTTRNAAHKREAETMRDAEIQRGKSILNLRTLSLRNALSLPFPSGSNLLLFTVPFFFMSNFTIFIFSFFKSVPTNSDSDFDRLSAFICLFQSVGVSTRIPSDSFTFYLTVGVLSRSTLSLSFTVHISFIPLCFLHFCSPTHYSHFSPTFLTIPLISVNPAFQSKIARSNFIIAFFSISAFEYFRDLLMQASAFVHLLHGRLFFLQWATFPARCSPPLPFSLSTI